MSPQESESSQNPGPTHGFSHLFAPPSMSSVRWLMLQIGLAVVGWAAGWLITVRLGLRFFSSIMSLFPGDPQATHTTDGMPLALVTICVPAGVCCIVAIALGRWRRAQLRDYAGVLVGLIAGAIYVYVQLVYWQYGGFGGAGRP